MAAPSVPFPRLQARRLPGRVGHVPRPPGRIVAIAVAALLVLTGGWLWLRDSPLVSVRQVTVTGADGPQAAQISRAVEDAARGMTTLHVQTDALRKALEPFPVVEDIRVHPAPLHRLRVEVIQHDAVGAVLVGGRRVPVAASGLLLTGAPAGSLPSVPLKGAPAGDHLRDPRALAAVRVLGAAPRSLRLRVAKVFLGPTGLTARLSNGPQLVFGDTARLAAKWAAAVAVLADPSSAGTTALDLRVPERPAAAGLEQAAEQTQADGAAAAGAASATTPGTVAGAAAPAGTTTAASAAPAATATATGTGVPAP
ncbi:MAG: cell division protein FtsQ [Solirubrobacteraceae bacterium]|jgi:cell division protein FtsQ|nr:cell division protein FtsQ [Solirubrobacteraceae bacterium]